MAWPTVNFHAGPFLGMRYITRAEDWDHQYVYHAQDAFPTPDGGYGVRAADASVAPTGMSANSTIQGEHVFRTVDGTVRDMIVAGGELWRRTNGDFTRDITTANLTDRKSVV